MATHPSILAWRIPLDRGAWWATVHGVAKGRTRLSTQHSTYYIYLFVIKDYSHNITDLISTYFIITFTAYNADLISYSVFLVFL